MKQSSFVNLPHWLARERSAPYQASKQRPLNFFNILPLARRKKTRLILTTKPENEFVSAIKEDALALHQDTG